jgi:hypothetical protein
MPPWHSRGVHRGDSDGGRAANVVNGSVHHHAKQCDENSDDTQDGVQATVHNSSCVNHENDIKSMHEDTRRDHHDGYQNQAAQQPHRQTDKVTACTFHSVATLLLRMFGTDIGIPKTFNIYSADEQRKEALLAAKRAGITAKYSQLVEVIIKCWCQA